jgi:hypothetical protein
MLTVFLILMISLVFLFLIDSKLKAGGAVLVLGEILMLVIGGFVANAIGNTFPMKTVVVDQQLQPLSVGMDGREYYLQEDKDSSEYTYQADGSLNQISIDQVDLVIVDASVLPHIEETWTELNFPEDQKWKREFGLYGLMHKTQAFLPQGSVYIVTK